MSPRKKLSEQQGGYSGIAVIYARYSSHNQRDVSIEQQVENCREFAERNNLLITEVYADRAITGKTDRRPNFQRMMRDAAKSKFQYVVAWKSNRMGRNMLDAMMNDARLRDMGVRCLYTEEDFDDTAAGRFALRTMMNVNQFYSENMAEDIKRGMRDNAENCKVNGAIPLGYVRGLDGRYAIEPTEAAIVREIYKRVLEGESFVDIANDLNGRGIKTKRKGLWNKNSFHRLLANDNYIGVYRHSGYVNEQGIPPILEKEVFYAMQRHLETKKNPRGRHRENNDYLLTGKLHCGYCKSFMVGISGTSKTGDKHYYYTCNDRRAGGSCKKENVRKGYIEQTVAVLTQRFILQDEVIEWIAASAMEVLAQSSSEAEIAAMESELAADRKAAKNIMNAIEQGIFTAMTKDRLLELELDISTLEKSIALARAASEETVMEKERIIWTLEQLRDGDATSKDYQKRLFDTFVKAVYLWDDKIEVHYYYSGEKNVLTSSLKEAAGGGGSGAEEVLINSPKGHHMN